MENNKKKVINRLGDTLAEVSARVNQKFKDCTPADKISSLVIANHMGEKCKKLSGAARASIVKTVEPKDIDPLFNASADGKVYNGEIAAVNTLFGVEYSIGGLKWKIATKKGVSASAVLINAAASNKALSDTLVAKGILVLTPGINYNAIHKALAGITDAKDIPADLEILKSIVKLVPTEKTVTVSTIKEGFVPEPEEK